MSEVNLKYYQSRIVVPRYGKGTGREAGNIRYRMHKLFWKAFSEFETDSSEEKKQPFLYQVESRSKDEYICFVQSKTRPSWENVLGVRCDGVKERSFRLNAGDHLYFRLRTSPGKRDRNGKKVGIINSKEADEWFHRVAVKSRFRLLQYISVPDKMTIKRPAKSKEGKKVDNGVFVLSHQFDGSLVVEEPGSFGEQFLKGFGTKKYLGFGMMMVAR